MKLYREPLNIKNAFVRAIISLPFVLPEIPVFILNFYLLARVLDFFKIVFDISMGDYYGEIRSEGFPALFFSSIILFLIHIIIYALYRLVLKIKINLKLAIIFLVTAILFPQLDYFDGGSIISFSTLFLTIAFGYIFVLIQFIIFSGLIYWADLKYEEKHFRKIILSSLASIVLGFIVSRLLWPFLLLLS